MAPPDAFVALYEREAEKVLLYLTRRTFDAEIALDLTAETFAQAWRGWSAVRLDSAEEVLGWLFTIARRQLGRYLRRGRVERRAMNEFGFSVPTMAEDEIAEIERAAELDMIRPTLQAALETLNADQRAAVRLRVIDELSYRDVAEQLGVTEQTVRARVSRGLRALADALEPDLVPERSTL
jgi:RNA polymerase sigma factor (sigma-70 family)